MSLEATLVIRDGEPRASLWPTRDGLETWLKTLPKMPDPARLSLVRAVADQIDAFHLGPIVLKAIEAGDADPELARVASALVDKGFGKFAGPLPAVLAREYRELLDSIELAVGGDDDDSENDPFAGWSPVGNEATA